MSELKRCPCCGAKAYVGILCCVCKNCGLIVVKNTIEEAIETWNTRKAVDDVLERLGVLAEKAMNNSEKAAELGEAYERHMIFNGAKGAAFEEAIEIVKEVMGY